MYMYICITSLRNAGLNLILNTCSQNKIIGLCRETFVHVPSISSEKHKGKIRKEIVKLSENIT